MKRLIFIIWLMIFSTVNLSSAIVFAKEPELDASSAILVDISNPMVLYEKNINAKIQPSGYTKIVTALVVLQNCEDLNQMITASRETINDCDFSFGNMGVLANEELSAKELLEGMLVYDAAEAGELLAGFTFGNYGKFISKMNELAKSVGAENTNFKNAGGYYHEEQYTTVNDMAKIIAYAMENPEFAQIVKKGMVEIEPTNKYREKRYLANTNMFVGRTRSLDFYSPKVSGVKTAYMKDHGYGISIMFENSMGKFMCVTAGGKNSTSAHNDAQKLREYVAKGFTNVKIAKKGDIIEEIEIPNGAPSHVLLKASNELSVRLPVDFDEKKIFKWTEKNASIKAPIEKDTVLGRLIISYDGKNVGRVNLTAYDDVDFSLGKSINLVFTAIFTSPFFYVPLILVTGFVIRTIFKANKEKLKRKK